MKTNDKGEPAWRVSWQEKTATNRWTRHELVEYADTQSKAVNQALAKIRQSNPNGQILACNRLML